MALFDENFLKKLEQLHIISKRVLGGQMRAERRSRKRGAGLEFADYKQYLPGDDFRSLDWNAYVRLDKLLLRLFEEEEDLPIYILLDSSRSMAMGSPPKFDYARKVVAALSYIGLAHLDRISIFSFSDTLKSELPRVRGKQQIHRVLRYIEDLPSGGNTSLNNAARSFLSGNHRRGLVVLISDFFDENGYEDALSMIVNFRYELFALQLSDTAESHPQLMGDLRLIDSETGEVREVTITAQLLREYQAAYTAFCDGLADFCKRRQIGLVQTENNVPFEDLVLNIFRQGRFVA